MHEVSLIEGVVALVEDERRKQNFSRVRLIRLKLGALGHAEPEALRFCFAAVTRGTIADGARLDIDIVPGEGWCSSCSLTVCRSKNASRRASSVGALPVRMTAGDELRVSEMEVE